MSAVFSPRCPSRAATALVAPSQAEGDALLEGEAMSVTRPYLGGAVRFAARYMAVLAVVAGLAATQAVASPVTYAVDRKVDVGTITGTIGLTGEPLFLH